MPLSRHAGRSAQSRRDRLDQPGPLDRLAQAAPRISRALAWRGAWRRTVCGPATALRMPSWRHVGKSVRTRRHRLDPPDQFAPVAPLARAAVNLPREALASRSAMKRWRDRLPRAVHALAAPRRIERTRPERPLEAIPAGRGVTAVHVRSGPEEAVAPDLALEGTRGQVGVSLARDRSLDARQRNRPAHPSRTPRRI